MPEWLQKIIDAFKKANPTATAEQLKEFEDVAKAAAPPTQTPPTQPPVDGKGTPLVIPPEVQAMLDQQKKALEDLGAQLKLVTDDTKTRQAAQAADLQAAQAKRYTDHVGKLLTEGRVTKAQHDAMVKPDSDEYKKYFGALDVFIDTSTKWPVDKTLVKPEPPTPGTQAAAGAQTVPMTPGHVSREDRAAIAKEFKDAQS